MIQRPAPRTISAVGFIGLGDQGAPMARAIAERGWVLHVWARRPQSLAALGGVPHTVSRSVAELGRNCDLIGLCLRHDGDVEGLLPDLLGAVRPGSIVVNHGTGSPDTCRSFEHAAEQAGAYVLDAPVSGGAAAAAEHALTVMVGGDADAFARAEPVLTAFARSIVHLGPAGSGQIAKLLNNALYAANLANASDMLVVAESLGFDVQKVAQIVETSSGASFALQALSRHIPMDAVQHAQDLVRKDLTHFAELLQTRGVDAMGLAANARRGIDAIPASVQRIGAGGPVSE